MRGFFETLGGLWQLLRLGLLSKFRFGGPYWKWRRHTAFGRGTPPRGELVRGVLEYGRWMHRMRKL
jgi:hypothetical protein